MEVTFNNQHIFFNLFYFLAFAFLTLAVIIKGRQHGYPFKTLLLFLGTMTLAVILGSRLATIPLTSGLVAHLRWLAAHPGQGQQIFHHRE